MKTIAAVGSSPAVDVCGLDFRFLVSGPVDNGEFATKIHKNTVDVIVDVVYQLRGTSEKKILYRPSRNAVPATFEVIYRLKRRYRSRRKRYLLAPYPKMSFARLQSEVQQIQSSIPLQDAYTGAPELLKSRPILQHQALVLPHAHPAPRRWTNPGGWGARHTSDDAPFNLWDASTRSYRLPNKEELKWCQERFGGGAIVQTGWFMSIQTTKPPQPVPLTIGCMPVVFTSDGEDPWSPLPRAGYSNPRLPDPAPSVAWDAMSFPTKEQNIAVLESLKPLANVRGIIYMPHWTVVELHHGDGRRYAGRSLPGNVGGRAALYYHEETSYFKNMSKKMRTRRFNLEQQQPGGIAGKTPQDKTNYMDDCSFISPGCRVESGCGATGSQGEGINAATAAGVKLQKSDGTEALTVSHHGFLISTEVFHPLASGKKIGDVFDIRPELDISLVKLTPEASRKFRNDCYFQAETPKVLFKGTQIKSGSWYECDGMSSGFVSLLTYASAFFEPERPHGHPAIEFGQWEAYSVNAVFGIVNDAIADGMCGAPIVECETGGVAGFFHMSDGFNCRSAHLDDLIAEGWQLA